jgi:hypothetical protein
MQLAAVNLKLCDVSDGNLLVVRRRNSCDGQQIVTGLITCANACSHQASVLGMYPLAPSSHMTIRLWFTRKTKWE